MLEWKLERNGSTALLLKGARRVGKSTVAKAFAEKEYKSYILIASCLSIGYFEQCMPYFFLEISSYRMQRNIKYLAVTGKIFIQLLFGLIQELVR